MSLRRWLWVDRFFSDAAGKAVSSVGKGSIGPSSVRPSRVGPSSVGPSSVGLSIADHSMIAGTNVQT